MLDFSDPNSAMLLGLGSGLLSAGGPSSKPTNLGQAFGQAMPQAMQMRQMAEESQLAKLDRQMKIKEYLAKQEEAKRKQIALGEWVSSLPPDQQAFAKANPEEAYKAFLKSQESFKLGAGETQYGFGGKQIAALPAKPSEFEQELALAGYKPGTPEYTKFIKDRLVKQTTHAPGTTLNVDAKQETKEAEAFGKGSGEMYSSIQKAAFTAPSNIAKLNQMENLLSRFSTGSGTKIGMQGASVLKAFGIDIDPNLSDKEAFEALSNELALRAKNSADGTNLMPGAMSEQDRNFLVALVPNLGKSKDANILGIQVLKMQEKRAQDVAKLARAYRKRNGSLEGFEDELEVWAEKNPMFANLTAPVAAQQPQEMSVVGRRKAQ